jgi:predicted RNA-binding Zn-ribbon protein involved in translation (DUF1610 family)
MLHKDSRFAVEHMKHKEITHVFAGDCSGIHDETNLGKNNNQIVQQNPEMKLFSFIKYKYESETKGVCDKIEERYTSRTCPNCGHVHKKAPSGREFSCKECGYKQDRDAVGAINIFDKGWKHKKEKEEQTKEFVCDDFNKSIIQNVSFHDQIVERRCLLARPYGVKVKEHLSYKHHMLFVNSSPKKFVEGKSEKKPTKRK